MNKKEQEAFDAVTAENAQLKDKIQTLSSENASAEKISQLEADLASKSESFEKEVSDLKAEIVEKDKTIESLKTVESDLKAEIAKKDEVIAELSAANSSAGSSDIITIGDKNYQSIAKKFHMDGKLVTIADLKQNTSLAQKALELKFLKENETI